jgi:hypothetical protein
LSSCSLLEQQLFLDAAPMRTAGTGLALTGITSENKHIHKTLKVFGIRFGFIKLLQPVKPDAFICSKTPTMERYYYNDCGVICSQAASCSTGIVNGWQNAVYYLKAAYTALEKLQGIRFAPFCSTWASTEFNVTDAKMTIGAFIATEKASGMVSRLKHMVSLVPMPFYGLKSLRN